MSQMGDDKIGFAGAMVFAAGGVTKEELVEGLVVFTEGYSGGTLTQPLFLARSPVNLLEAATKSYVDSSVASHSRDYTLHVTPEQRLLLDSLTVTAEELNALHGLTANVDVELMRKVDRSGDTMTGMFTLFADPVDGLHAATKQYVDQKLSVDLTNLSNTKVNKYGDTLTGYLSVHADPLLDLHVTNKGYVDIATTALNNRLTTTESYLFTLRQDPVTKSYVETQVALKINKAGDTMTGALLLHADPSVAMQAATKAYVDGRAALKLNLAGGVMTGFLTLSGAPTATNHATTKTYVDTATTALSTRVATLESTTATLVNTTATKTYIDTQDAKRVAKTGDTMTGPLVLFGNPVENTHAASKQYVDTADTVLSARVSHVQGQVDVLALDPTTKTYVDTADALKLNLAGGVMTGAIVLNGAPTLASHAVSKGYVDSVDSALNTRLVNTETTIGILNSDPVTKTYVNNADSLKLAKAGDVMTGSLTLSGNPTALLHAATKGYVDSVDAAKINRLGDTMQGYLTLNGDPLQAMHGATKQYADTKVSKAGDTLTGALVLSGAPTSALHATTKAYVDAIEMGLDARLSTTQSAVSALALDPVTKQYVDTQDSQKLSLTGGTLSGALTLAANPVSHLQAATKQYVDAINTATDARLDPLESSVSVLNADPVTKSYVTTQDALKLSKAGDTMTGALVLAADPTVGMHAATKQYTDAILATHVTNTDVHLSAAQNTLIGAITVNSAEINHLSGVVSNVQAQLDSKLALSGGVITGDLVLAPQATLSVNRAPLAPTDATNKAYVDALIQGLKWKDPILDSNLVGSADVPATSALNGYTYLVGAAPTGAWNGLANHLVTYKEGEWVDVLGRAVQIGDRLGVGFEAASSELDASVLAFDNKIVRITGLSPVTFTEEASLEHDTTLVTDTDSYHYGSSYSYTLSSGWVKISSGLEYTAGLGLSLNGATLSVNIGAGLQEQVSAGVSSVTAKVYPGAGLQLTQDGITPSLSPSASLGVSVDNATVVLSSGKVAINPALMTAFTAKLDKAGGAMTGSLVLSGDPTSSMQAATKQYVDVTDAVLNTRLVVVEGTVASLATDPVAKAYVDAQVATRVSLSGGTLTGALTLAANPVSNLQAATKQYVDAADNLKVSKAGDTLTGALTLAADPVNNLHASTKQYSDTKLSKAGGTMTGLVVLSGDPVNPLNPATKQYVDAVDTTILGRVINAENAISTLGADPTTKAYVDAQSALKLNLSGGTLTGALTLSGTPSSGLHATTKAYVDTADALKLSKAGDAMSGFLTLASDPTANLHAATKQYVDTKLNISGGAMTGLLTLFSNPTANLHAATKQYVDSNITAINIRLTSAEGSISSLVNDRVTKTYVDAADASKVSKAGDTMTGLLTLSGAPVNTLHAATKSYVDNADALIASRVSTAEGNIATLSTAASTTAYVDAQVGLKLNKAGDAMTGFLTLAGAPTSNNHAATKAYVDNADSSLNTRVSTIENYVALAPSIFPDTNYVNSADNARVAKSGDTMTGSLVLSGAPTQPLHAATKAYVDSVATGGSSTPVPSWFEPTNNQVGAGWVQFQTALNEVIAKNRANIMSCMYADTPSTSNFPSNSSFSGGVLLSDGRVFLIPLNTTSTRIYNPSTNTVTTPNGSYPGNNAHSSGILLKDGRVFMTPWYSTSARIYSPFTNSLYVPSYNFGTNGNYSDSVLLPDGRVFLVPYNSTSARIYDPVTDTVSTPAGDYPGSGAFSAGVLMPDGRVFCVPYMSTSARIYDPVSNTLSTPAGVYPGNYAYSSGVLLADGRIFMVPHSATTSRIYNPNTNTLTTPNGSYPGTDAFINGVLLMDGRVFCAPKASTTARVYDPYTDTVYTPSDIYAANNYTGAVQLPDGRLFVVPTNSNRGRMITATHGHTPMAICSSPFYNRK